jgi:sugar/nucleoside kinase (ribokinase family)
MKLDIIVVGDYCLDFIVTGLEALPTGGGQVQAKGGTLLPGGAYNTVLALHRLGLQVGWAGDFGEDDFSQIVLSQARREGLLGALFTYHTHPLRRVTVSLSLPDDRAFISYNDPAPILSSGFKGLIKGQSKALYIPGLYYGIGFETGALLAKLKGMKIIMDGNSSQRTLDDTPQLRKALLRIDLFLPNAAEASRITGKENIEDELKVLAKFCPLVVIKDGANGSYAIADDQIYHSSAIPVNPVDTTGAGDCFNAGFIKAWFEGYGIEDCLKWGNIVGGLSTLAEGGTTQIIRTEDVLEWYE